MKILLAHNSLYYPFAGGGDKSNRLLMEAMARRGHLVSVVSRVEQFGAPAHDALLAELQRRGITDLAIGPAAVRFAHHGVDVHTVTRDPNLRNYFAARIEEFDPDVIVTSTDDPAQILFDIAVRAERAHVVYLVRATIAAPFGPDSSSISAERTERLRQASGAVGVSEYVARYTREWGKLDCVHVPISLLDPVDASAEPPALGRFDNPYVLMVNPCAVKGQPIFTGLARQFPDLAFAAVPGWGTTAADRAELDGLPNVTLLPFADDVDDLLRLARVVLVPSLWAEARSRMVVESFYRGVPVMAANTGGLQEAMLGCDYLLPVNPIVVYKPAVSQQMVPEAEVPEQDVRPWAEVLGRLVTDRTHWEELAAKSRRAALAYAKTLDGSGFERYLEQLLTRPRPPRVTVGATLSADKRKLLERRLKQRAATSAWLPTWTPPLPGHLRLFVFPHAGAGALSYLSWRNAISGVDVHPVLLPGRENRVREQPFSSMNEAISALGPALSPMLEPPFVFFGHSMGAGMAWELVRWLRQQRRPLPGALIVSAARAPHLRTPSMVEPSDEQLLDQLKSLGGLSHAGEHLATALPVLRADTRLYRQWQPAAEEPLDIPVLAYGGTWDESLGEEAIQAWQEVTTGPFRHRLFPGGHFYLRETSPLLAALQEDLCSLGVLSA